MKTPPNRNALLSIAQFCALLRQPAAQQSDRDARAGRAPRGSLALIGVQEVFHDRQAC
jgi:hypothetical protein